MHIVLTLIRKDLLIFLRDPFAVVLTFAVPAVLIIIFGMAFSGGGSGPTGIRLLIVNEAPESRISAGIIMALQQETTFQVRTQRTLADGESAPLDRAHVEHLLRANPSAFRYALILPENLVADRFGINIELLYNPQNAIENGIVQGILRKALFSNAFPLIIQDAMDSVDSSDMALFEDGLSGLIASYFPVAREQLQGNLWPFNQSAGTTEEDESATGSFLEDWIVVQGTQVFGKERNPAAQSVAGFAVMFMLFSLTGAASSLFHERDKHIFLRLLSGRVSRSHILFSKFIFCSMLGLLQLSALLVFGHLVFGIISHAQQLLPLVLISLCTACAATAFGMLLASIAKTPASASGLGTFLILSMSALGGAMFPLFMMPVFMRDFIAPLTLVYWGVDGVLGVLWRDATVGALWFHLLVLTLTTAVILLIARHRFQRGDIFR